MTPNLVKSADAFTRDLLSDFNRWLSSKHPELPGLRPIRPVGSGVYYEKDIEEDPEKVYGDIDFLIEYPVLESTEDEKKNETTSVKFYNKKLFEFFRETQPAGVDINDSKGDGEGTAVIIAEVEPEKFVQIDFVVTHKKYVTWAKSRFTPIRNIKGFVTGGLYASLAEALMMSIGDKGARAKFRQGVLVPYSQRKDTEEKVASLDFSRLFQDIVEFFIRMKYGDNKSMFVAAQIPGVNVNELSVDSIVNGIKSLASALEQAGIFDGKSLAYTSSHDFLAAVSKNFADKMNDVLENKKFEKAEDPMAVKAREKAFKTALDAKNQVEKLLS